MKAWKVRLLAGAAVGVALALTGCDEKSSSTATNAVTSAADAAKDTASKAVDAAKDAGTKVADAGTKAVDAAKDAGAKAADVAKDAGAKVADAAAALKTEGTKWLTDTVEKQWPAMKTEFDGIVKKVADIKDVGIKTKAESLVKDLQGQIPALEKIVGDLKGFKDGDFGSLFTKAKEAWDGFSKKFGDLKALLPK